MNILYIADTYEIGGGFLSFIGMIEAMIDLYDDVTPILLTSKNGKNNEFADTHEIENYYVGYRAFLVNRGSTIPRRIIRLLLKPCLKLRYELSNIFALKKIENYVDLSTIDIIHSNSNRIDIGAIISRKYNIPHIWHIREFSDWDYNCFSLRKKHVHYMNDSATCFIAVSKAVAKRWVEKGLDSDKVRVIYNGVNSASRGMQETKEQPLKGVISGFIAPFKGQFDLIRSINLIKNQIANKFELDIYGNAALEYLAILKLYIKAHKLDKIIKFKGYVNDVQMIYADYDIGFMCSKAEGFGRVTAEYMMNGLCVIASDTGANREIIDDGCNGLIYKYKDNVDLASKIKYVIDNRKIASDFADKGYEKAMNNFTKEKNAEDIYLLYKGILDNL